MNTANETQRKFFVLAILFQDGHINATALESFGHPDYHHEKFMEVLSEQLATPDNKEDPYNVFGVMPNQNNTKKMERIEKLGKVGHVAGSICKGLDSLDQVMTFAYNHNASHIFMLNEMDGIVPQGWYHLNLDAILWSSSKREDPDYEYREFHRLFNEV